MFFENMNRKQKRQFNKLSPDEQAPIIEAELIQKVSPVMAKEIANAMIVGGDLVWEKLYTDFVEEYDNLPIHAIREEGSEIIIAILSTIRAQHLRIEASKAKEDKDEVS